MDNHDLDDPPKDRGREPDPLEQNALSALAAFFAQHKQSVFFSRQVAKLRLKPPSDA